MRKYRTNGLCLWLVPLLAWHFFGCGVNPSFSNSPLMDSGSNGSLYWHGDAGDKTDNRGRDATADSATDYSDCIPNSQSDGSCPWNCPEVCDGIDNDCDGRTDEPSDACDLPNAAPRCAQKQCVIAQCTVPYQDCDKNVANGCETPLNAMTNCGACNETCTGLSCAGGVCSELVCARELGDCNMDPDDGCETSLTTLTDCVLCDRGCAMANASAKCTGTSCDFIKCKAGFADCDSDLSNGCETALNTLKDCGECGKKCDASNGKASCAGGRCTTSTCDRGFADCNSDPNDGCETSLQTTEHCGSCDESATCGPLDHAVATCATGSCRVQSCAAGYGDCDDEPSNGCETVLNTNQNCGACRKACGLANATASCETSVCKITQCNETFSDCNADPNDGCEADLRAITSCGGCANNCTALPNIDQMICNSGACSIQSCDPGYGDCNAEAGCETPLGTMTDCSVCGDPCPALPNPSYPHASQSACSAYRCSVAQCDPGYDDCNGSLSDGCEINLQNDVNHCNGCGNRCGPYANATALCNAGSCALSCTSGYDNCDENLDNGCEVQLNTLSNCGGCGTICDIANASESCATGACTPVSCDYGYANCDVTFSNGCEYQLMDLPNGLAGFWSLNETSGTVASDGSGRGHHGALTNMNGNEWTGGAMGGALQLDGVNDHVAIGDIGTGIKSLSFWMKGDVITDSKSTGAKYPNAIGPRNEWINPIRAYSNDGFYATMTAFFSSKTQDWGGFGFNLPSVATINGIAVTVKYKTDDPLANSSIDLELSWNMGSNYTSTGYTSGNFSSSGGDRVGTWGGSTDTWGHAWTVTEINNNLRIRIKGSCFNLVTNYVDYITVNVFYTAPATYKLIDVDGTDQIEVVLGKITTTGFPGTTSVYVDGVAGSAITSGWHHVAITDTTGVNASALQLGRVGIGYFDGAIDEVRAYNRVLSIDDVSFLSGHRGCP